MTYRRVCCYMGREPGEPNCDMPAEYEIHTAGCDPYDFSDACPRHLEPMLDDSAHFTIRRIPPTNASEEHTRA